MSGIPWRFDVENVPQGQRVTFLACLDGADGGVYYSLGHWEDDMFHDEDGSQWFREELKAWCPLAPPLPPVEQTHPSSNGDAE